jgi:hypothetical protein
MSDQFKVAYIPGDLPSAYSCEMQEKKRSKEYTFDEIVEKYSVKGFHKNHNIDTILEYKFNEMINVVLNLCDKELWVWALYIWTLYIRPKPVKCYLSIPKETVFTNICEDGYLDFAKYFIIKYDIKLYNAQLDLPNVFIRVCENGHIFVAKWLYLNPKINANGAAQIAFSRTIKNKHYELAHWLLSNNTKIYKPEALHILCVNNDIHGIKWLLDHIKNIDLSDRMLLKLLCVLNLIEIVELMLTYIKYDYRSINLSHFQYNPDYEVLFLEIGSISNIRGYKLWSTEIKNILIAADLVNPSKLDRTDLEYYLSKTDNVVPPDFTTEFNDITVKKRGSNTKSARSL